MFWKVNFHLRESRNISKGPLDNQYYCAIFWFVQYNWSYVGNIERLCNILCDFQNLENILCKRDNIVASVGNIAQYPVSWSLAVVWTSLKQVLLSWVTRKLKKNLLRCNLVSRLGGMCSAKIIIIIMHHNSLLRNGLTSWNYSRTVCTMWLYVCARDCAIYCPTFNIASILYNLLHKPKYCRIILTV